MTEETTPGAGRPGGDAEAEAGRLPLFARGPDRSAARPLPSSDETAETDPVAVVAVDVPLPHLDRPFEYTVPRHLDDLARPGVRVKVRFAGQDVDGYLLERRARPEHTGRLAPLRRVVGDEVVLPPRLLDLCRAVAARHAGSLADVLRLAVPPRHARAEKALPREPEEGSEAAGPGDPPGSEPPEPPAAGPWADYPAGPSLVRRLTAGESPTAAWSALPLPVSDWAEALAVAAEATLRSGRGVVIVVPDHRDVDRVDAALTGRLGRGRHVRLTADQGPQARYTAWLKALRGHVRCVVGARAAAFAPVHDVGLLAWWDDGDDLHAEPRAPYPHVRDVLRIRAGLEGAALLAGGFARTTHVQALVEAGDLRDVLPEPASRRRGTPRVRVAGEGHDAERDGPAARAHLPSAAWRAARAALETGPVLVQVPRRGYLPSLSCAHCRAPARCPTCHGPLSLPGPGAPPTCRWCGHVAHAHVCPECGGGRLRSGVVGARRTAEELGRAFPGTSVRTSGGGEVLARVGGEPALVIATPGAEPVAAGGYAATLLLDAWASLDRPRLDAGEEAVRRWLGAAALTRGVDEGGVVVLCGAPEHVTLPAIEALVRWAPEWFARRELAERHELGLPPSVWTARLSGPYGALVESLRELDLPPGVDAIGPVPLDALGATGDPGASRSGDGEAARPAQALVRGPWSAADPTARLLRDLRRTRSARRGSEPVSVQVGAADVGG